MESKEGKFEFEQSDEEDILKVFFGNSKQTIPDENESDENDVEVNEEEERVVRELQAAFTSQEMQWKYEWEHPENHYLLTNDPKKIDLDILHAFLSKEAYWSIGISKRRVAMGIKHSIPFSLLAPDGLFVGFARLTTDYSTFTYISDVYVNKQHRKRGLSKWFIQKIMETEYITNVRSVFLMTKSAHKLYSRFGFEVVENRCMVYRPGIAKDVGRFDPLKVEFI